MASSTEHLTIAYMNIRGQTGLDITKQVQIEHFLRFYNVDILNCQEINILSDSFENCNFINSSYNIISNNASNKYGTCCLVSSTLQAENIKYDINGRIIIFNIDDITFGNIYLPSGNDPTMRSSRENYCAETIPQLLINCKDRGCIGGDWNAIIKEVDATRNPSQKISPSLRRLVQTFKWTDSFREVYPHARAFSRYYDHNRYGEGATRIDRQYYWGNLEIIEAKYVGVAFSDHHAYIVKLKLPGIGNKILLPKSRPKFKAKPEVIEDPTFYKRLQESFPKWVSIKQAGLGLLPWWELIVKPGLKSLLINRSKEINKEKNGRLNILLIRQAYLVSKIQGGDLNKLGELKQIQIEVQQWYERDCHKIKLQAKAEEINKNENVRIYHHELHAKHIRKTSILKLDTECGSLTGHDACARYLEKAVGDLLLPPADLDEVAQHVLLQGVKKVFTAKDNEMLSKIPTKKEVKESLWSSNPNAAPGTDGLTNTLYRHCWEILGESLVEVVQALCSGEQPTLSQRTSLMVYGAKANKPPTSTDPKHKRRISLLNSDFKIASGIYSMRFKKVATHTLNPNQLSMGEDRKIHHGINKARDAILAANTRNEGVGILDNDYMAAFDYMVLTWILKVLEVKGLDRAVLTRLQVMYNNHLTVVVVNNIHGRCFPNNRWSIRQGDKPSSSLFCYGLDPLLDWLEIRLRGIPIYKNLLSQDPPELYKLIAYVDDVKPSITSIEEFNTVDFGSALFEKSSGCKLHRDPRSGKVKFLPLGRWKGSLRQQDLPVDYIVLSEHLDMVGVKLTATYQKTRKVNGDEIQDKVRAMIGAWRGGKFMPLTNRSHSLNTYCLSKVWFKCSSINLRVCDFTKITSNIKSWLLADQLEKPEEFILYLPRKLGGLGLFNVQFKALSLLIRTFLESAIIPKFKHSQYHVALYLWHVEGRRDITCPHMSPYYDMDFFNYIKRAKNNKVMNIKRMTSGQWYRMLVEEQVTHIETNSILKKRLSRAEIKSPQIDWERSWSLTCTPGLPSTTMSFLWRMCHNILPCPTRLFRLQMQNIRSDQCTHCDLQAVGDLAHCLILCPYNNGAGEFLLNKLSVLIPNLSPAQVVHLDLDVRDKQLPLLYLTGTILQEIWTCRKENKPCHLNSIRATLEASINILRKSRHNTAVDILVRMIDTN